MLSGGDVDDRGERAEPFRCLDRVEADLHWDLSPVLVLTEQVASGTHPPCRRCSEVVADERDVLLPHGDRYQQIDRLSQELVSRIAEHLLRTAVDEDDPAVLVDHQHRVGGRLDGEPKPRLHGVVVA